MRRSLFSHRCSLSGVAVALTLCLSLAGAASAHAGSLAPRTIWRGLKSRIQSLVPHRPTTVGRKVDARAKAVLLDSVAQGRIVTEKVQRLLEAKKLGKAVTDPALKRLAGLMDSLSMTKNDKSPVTVADFAVQAIVSRGLERAVGKARLLGEEDARALRGFKNRRMRRAVVEAVRLVDPTISAHEVLTAIDKGNDKAKTGSFWALDPIDGTKGYLNLGQYAISLGRVVNGSVDFGILASPNLSSSPKVSPATIVRPGTVYMAEKGKGAVIIEGGDPSATQRPLHIAQSAQSTKPKKRARGQRRRRGKTRGELAVIARVTGNDSQSPEMQKLATMLGRKLVAVSMDSASKYAAAVLHNGVYFRRQRSGKVWDHSAGTLVAAEAGLKVTDFDGKPLDFGAGITLANNRGIVVAPPAIHGAVLKAFAKDQPAKAKTQSTP